LEVIGIPKFNDLTGQKFARLTAIKRVENNKYGRVQWLWLCECGNEKKIGANEVVSKNTKSCGCLAKEILDDHNNTQGTHKMTNSRIYNIWRLMRQRCYKNYNVNYKNYGDRGIKICDEWLTNFVNFYNWAIQNGYRDDLEIDRINVNGNYEPSNCRWADHLTQGNNRRTNHIITINGVTKTASEWGREYGLNSKTILYRLKIGWKNEELLSKPYVIREENRRK